MVTYTTSELALAAFLRMKGVKLIKASKGQTGKFEFIFDDSVGVCQKHVIDFLNSEFSAFDSQIKSLKKMLYSK
jgi:hypothetical protein